MNYLSLMVSLFIEVFLIYRVKNGKGMLLDHRIIFVFIFIVLQLGASLRLFGVIACREAIYVMCLFAVVSYLLGTYLAQKFRFVDEKQRIGYFYNAKICYRSLYLFILLGIILMIPYMINIKNILMVNAVSDGLLLARNSLTAGDGVVHGSTSDLRFFLYTIIVEPLCFVLPPIMACDMLYGKKDKILLFGTISIILMKTLFVVNRATAVYAVFMILIVYYCNKDKICISRKIKGYLYLLSFLLGLIFIYVSYIRNYGDFLQSIYTYLFSSLILLDTHLDNIEASDLYSFGFASLFGFYNKIYTVIKVIAGFDYPEFYETLVYMIASTEDFHYLGGEMIMNAFVTPLWYLYLDGRYIGIIVGMLIYGFCVEKSRLLCIEDHNCRTDSLYAFLFLGVVLSIVRLSFSSHSYAFGLLMLFLFTKASKKNGNKGHNI